MASEEIFREALKRVIEKTKARSADEQSSLLRKAEESSFTQTVNFLLDFYDECETFIATCEVEKINDIRRFELRVVSESNKDVQLDASIRENYSSEIDYELDNQDYMLAA